MVIQFFLIKQSLKAILQLDQGLVVLLFELCEFFKHKAEGLGCLVDQTLHDLQVVEIFDRLKFTEPILAKQVLFLHFSNSFSTLCVILHYVTLRLL